MPQEDFKDWLLKHVLEDEIILLSRFFASQSIQALKNYPENLHEDLKNYHPSWNNLILAGSIFAQCNDEISNDFALLIAHSGLLYSNDAIIKNAAIAILSDAQNQRTIQLWKEKHNPDMQQLITKGFFAKLSLFKNESKSEIILENQKIIRVNKFQQKLWKTLKSDQKVAVSAPTASGKTYIILHWILSLIKSETVNLVVFLAPTRALVGEIERQLLTFSKEYKLPKLRISSLPFEKLGDGTRPTILVLTQERLHIFLNTTSGFSNIDLLVVDEAHKVSDWQRGIILQEAIEKINRLTTCKRIIQLTPLTENPEILFSAESSKKTPGFVIDNNLMITQNLIFMNDIKGFPLKKKILVRRNGVEHLLGKIDIKFPFGSKYQTIFSSAYEIGKNTTGTLVYADDRSQAEKIAILLANAISDDVAQDDELIEFSNFIETTIHYQYSLKEVVLKGVGFHYGNMPSLLRTELERLFINGKLRFLVCTSTLVEGVNLAAKNIVTMAPKKGRLKSMEGHDFWNLAGRAGRWGTDFFGNIICINTDNKKMWRGSVPELKKYKIVKATTQIFNSNSENFANFLIRRMKHQTLTSNDVHFEYLLSYLLNKKLSGHKADIDILEDQNSNKISKLIEEISSHIINIDSTLSVKHPGVSAFSLQILYNHLHQNSSNIKTFVPFELMNKATSVSCYTDLFRTINEQVFPVFANALLFPYALTTSRWMHGWPLSQIITYNWNYINGSRYKGSKKNIARVIRDSMSMVEEISRFKAPKYLSAYLDVLQLYLQNNDQSEFFPKNLRLDLYLEFGVATETLLSLIGVGLSRTSALALNQFIPSDTLLEKDVINLLAQRNWKRWDMPPVVIREINDLIELRLHLN